MTGVIVLCLQIEKVGPKVGNEIRAASGPAPMFQIGIRHGFAARSIVRSLA